MELIEGILTRSSIRQYTDEKLSDDLIKKLLEAGMAAPSAGNQQAWHFVVIYDRHILDEIQTFPQPPRSQRYHHLKAPVSEQVEEEQDDSRERLGRRSPPYVNSWTGHTNYSCSGHC